MLCKKLFFQWSRVLAISVTTLLAFSPSTFAQQEEVLHSFNAKGTASAGPYAGLTSDGSGNLYGTTRLGGSYNCGTVFELLRSNVGGWGEKVLHDFNNNREDGCGPESNLVLDAAGNLYGTTYSGGTSFGTVFELTPDGNGTWTEKILYSSFAVGAGGPYGSLVFDAAGNLYGTTANTVFELSPSSQGNWTLTTPHIFNNDGTDGYSTTSLVIDSKGRLYGTTWVGGIYGDGTVFELIPDGDGKWTETIRYNFNKAGTEGYNPAALIVGTVGNLFGAALSGGPAECTLGCGSIFELTPSAGATWTEKTLFAFDGSDGWQPASLIQDIHGNLYGAAEAGGSGACTYGCGVIFELVRGSQGTWTERVLHNFEGGSDGVNPVANPIFDSAGNLYGTTVLGGSYSDGTAYEINR